MDIVIFIIIVPSLDNHRGGKDSYRYKEKNILTFSQEKWQKEIESKTSTIGTRCDRLGK